VPHRPGLPLADAREALEIFLASDKVTGVVVTEFNAARDPAGVAARTLVDLLIVSLDVTT
jgi:arginase family enzyme